MSFFRRKSIFRACSDLDPSTIRFKLFLGVKQTYYRGADIESPHGLHLTCKKCNPFLLISTNPFLQPEQPSCEQFRFFNANASAKTTVRSFCRKLRNSIFGAKNVQAYKFKFCKLNKFIKHYPVYFPRKSKAFCAWTSPSGPPSVFEKYLIDQPFCTFWGCENRVWCLINLFCL